MCRRDNIPHWWRMSLKRLILEHWPHMRTPQTLQVPLWRLIRTLQTMQEPPWCHVLTPQRLLVQLGSQVVTLAVLSRKTKF